MSILEAIILGIIQGITEFVPVSSSGHIEIGKALLGIEIKDDLLFSVVVHAATALSTILVFRKDIWQIILDLLKFEWNESTQFAFKILLSMIPVGIIGLSFESYIETFFDGKIVLVAFMLLITGALLLFTHHFKAKESTDVTFLKALWVGLAQAIAILPGISRSGATIATALLVGIDKSKAARFSFLMVLPPILGASLLKFLKFMKTDTPSDLSAVVLIAGFLTSFVIGLFACKLMIEMVKKGKLSYFAFYCFAVSGLVLGYQFLK